MSRSGMGGDSRGLWVILRRMNRSITLAKQISGPVYDVSRGRALLYGFHQNDTAPSGSDG
jgi:hypothetical protein